ncbi:MAG: primosomal protein N', partial [Pirellulaceae bacterium]|nr:primosomal protein N' [Pirellulaceae bacterium]
MEKRQQPLFATQPAPWEVDEAEDRTVATVVFAEAPGGPFDYRVPDPLLAEVAVGKRIRVPLGRGNRQVTGYCVAVGPATGESATRALKDVQEVVDQQVLVSGPMLSLTRWMADYYLCRWGQVLEAVVPAGVRTGAGTRRMQLLHLTELGAGPLSELRLPPKQERALQVLADSAEPLTPDQLAEAVGCTRAPIRACIKKGLLRTE